MLYSEDTLNQIRNAVSIVDLVSEYVPLKKAGTSFSGICPFHSEKSPSFYVHPQKQCFHCFGCHKGGNVFTFLTAIEGLPFPDVVRKLADRAGVPLDKAPVRGGYSKAPVAHPKIEEALEWAAKYFNYLLTESPDYEFARDYLKKRGLSEISIQKFRLGVSPKGWRTLMDLMLKRNFTQENLVQAGLIIVKEDSNKAYDRFRERIMFPIRNAEGKTLGFGARLLGSDENQPKYLNSPESPLFSKRQQVYGLYENQRGIRTRGEMILVEGYMDVVGLSEKGVNNAVATMGTALTEEHCQTIRGYVPRVVTVFDPDAGGKEAWHRSVHLLLSSGLLAKDLTLPDEKDPDEFVQEAGSETFYQMCQAAPRQITKLLKEIASEGKLTEEGTATWLEKLSPILYATRRAPDRTLIWDNISLVLKVSHQALKEMSESYAGRKPAAPLTVPQAPSKPKAPTKISSSDKLDFDFFKACLDSPKIFLNMTSTTWAPLLNNAQVKLWLEKLAAVKSAQGWIDVLSQLIQNETDSTLQGMASENLLSEQQEGQKNMQTEGQPKVKKTEILTELTERLKSRSRELSIKALTTQIKLSEKMGDEKEGLRLLGELKTLRSPSS